MSHALMLRVRIAAEVVDFDEELARGLAAIADDMDPAGPQRVLSRIEGGRPRRWRARSLALVAGVAVTASVVAALNLVGLLGGGPPSTSVAPPPSSTDGPAESLVLPTKPGEPCAEARRFSLEDLTARADAPIWLPDSRRASTAALTGAWTCGGGDTPLLTFGNVTVSYEPGWTDVDVEQKWSDLVEELGEGYVQTIQGRPGLVQPVTEASPRGQVLLVNDGVLIRVLGDGSVPVEQLVDVPNRSTSISPWPGRTAHGVTRAPAVIRAHRTSMKKWAIQ